MSKLCFINTSNSPSHFARAGHNQHQFARIEPFACHEDSRLLQLSVNAIKQWKQTRRKEWKGIWDTNFDCPLCHFVFSLSSKKAENPCVRVCVVCVLCVLCVCVCVCALCVRLCLWREGSPRSKTFHRILPCSSAAYPTQRPRNRSNLRRRYPARFRPRGQAMWYNTGIE